MARTVFFRRKVVASLALVVLTSSVTAFADEPAPPTLDQARSAFVEGRELMEREEWTSAAQKFSYAALAKNTPGLRYYVGLCQEKAGLLVEARESYREARTLLESQAAADVEQLVPEALARVEADIPRLSVTGVPEGARLFVDGVEVPVERPAEVNPGERQLLVTRAGYEEFEGKVTLAPGRTEIVPVEMVVLAAAVEPPRPARPAPRETTVEAESERGGGRRVAVWTGIGVGSAGLVTGVVGSLLFASANGKKNDAHDRIDAESSDGDSACYEPSGDLARACDDLSASGKGRSLGGNLMIAGYATAGVGVVTALVFHYLWPEAPDAGLDIQAHAGRDRGFVTLSGRF